MPNPAPEPSSALRQRLRGFPEPTVLACAELKATGSADAFERALTGIITHLLLQPPPRPLSELPGTTKLVADLGLDSLTMVEMAFLFEDVFGTKLPHEEYVKVQTLDDLRTVLRAKLPAAPPA